MQYFEPNFVDEALVLLDRFGSGARLLAGGTRLASALRSQPDGVGALVNLKRIRELCDIVERDGALHIGALATAATLAEHPLVIRHAPVLALAASSMGARQLRSVATIGGNVCSGDPASDLCVALLACDARCEVCGPSDQTATIPIAQLLTKVPKAVEPSALLKGLTIPIRADKYSYQKMTTRRGFEMALVAIGFCCRLEGSQLCEPRLGMGGAAATPIRARAAEDMLTGKPFSLDLAREAARVAARNDATPQTDWRASAEFRRHLVATLAERAILGACMPNARGER